jgi:hypothetical protein
VQYWRVVAPVGAALCVRTVFTPDLFSGTHVYCVPSALPWHHKKVELLPGGELVGALKKSHVAWLSDGVAPQTEKRTA